MKKLRQSRNVPAKTNLRAPIKYGGRNIARSVGASKTEIRNIGISENTLRSRGRANTRKI